MSRLLFISSSETTRGAKVRRRRRGQAPLRARAIFMWAGATLVLATIAGSIAIDYCPSQIRFTHLHWALQRVDRVGSAPAVVCFGSSRFAQGIRTQEMEQSLRRVS